MTSPLLPGLSRLAPALFIFLLCTTAHAASKYIEVENCGSAHVVSGKSCEELKVQFDFSGCKLSSEPQFASRTICKGKTATARFQVGAYRYESKITSETDTWGGTQNWNSGGKLRQFEKSRSEETPNNTAKVEAPTKSTAKEAPTTQVETSSKAVAPASTSPFKFGGFADLRYTSYHASNDPLVASPHSESGFGLEDAALYANYEQGKLAVVFDASFRRSKDIDAGPTDRPNQSQNANFAFGVDKSQLYARYKLSPLVTFDFGQFDTIYGVELNDSKDRLFGKTGLLYDQTLPVTHTGFMVEVANKGAYVKAFAANPNNKGSYGTSAAGDDKTEYGGAVGYGNDFVHGQFGYMGRSILKSGRNAFGTRTLIDATLGAVLGSFSIDGEYSRVKDPSKNTLTASATDEESAGTAWMGLASYKFTDSVLIGARFETVKNDPTASDIDTAKSVGGTAHYRLSPELELRSEYIRYNFTSLNAAKWNDNRFNVAAVLTF